MNDIKLINPEDHVDDILEKYPELATFLAKRGVICVQCGEVFWGTLRELVEQKGKDIEEVTEAINRELRGE